MKNCFWIWPFGHIWGVNENNSHRRKCVLCGTESIRGVYDADWHFDISPYVKSLDIKRFNKSILALKKKRRKYNEKNN